MALKILSERANVGMWRIGGFEFFDEPRAIFFLNAAIEASGDDGFPVAERDFRFEMNFALIRGICRATFLQNLRMQFCAETESIPTFAAFKTDATNASIVG